jgi:hypothetical protein
MRSNAPRALGLGTMLIVLTALLCLAFAASHEGRTVTLAGLTQLAQGDSVLMSCARDVEPASGPTMWCSDPSSPHCIPAAPEAPRAELWDGPDSALLLSFAVPAATHVLLPWPRLAPSSLHARDSVSRLERPPRT